MKNKFDKFMERLSKHPFRNAIILLVAPVVTIHLLYTLPHMIGSLVFFKNCNFFKTYFFKAKIPAGNLLAYIGTVLTFCATFMLSITVYLSNKRQSEQLQIATNRTLITMNNIEKIQVKLIYEDVVIACIDADFNILSDATISEINMDRLTIEDRRVKRDKDTFSKKYENAETINLEYVEKNKISLRGTGLFSTRNRSNLVEKCVLS